MKRTYYVTNVIEPMEDDGVECVVGCLRVFTIPEAAQEWIKDVPNAVVGEYEVVVNSDGNWPKKIPETWEAIKNE